MLPTLAALLRDELANRGPDGARVLEALERGDLARLPEPLRDAVAAILSGAPEPRWEIGGETGGSRRLVTLPEDVPVVAVGDLHGRFDRVEACLAHAPEGAAVVQVGDLIDADLTWEVGVRADRYADALVERFGARVQGAVEASGTREGRGLLKGFFGEPLNAQTFGLRHDLVGALLALETVRAMRALTLAGPERVVVLLGNHEIDLLSGAWRFYARQKRLLLVLMGVDEPDRLRAALATAPDRAAAEALVAPWPELRWLYGLPWAARGAGTLLVHGGPTASTTTALRARGAVGPGDLAAWFAEHEALALHAPFFAEGTSIFAPNPNGDDPTRDLELLTFWLGVAGCDRLAVGHSPFLVFPRGVWLNTWEPAVQARLAGVEALGVGGAVIKLDSNLKRGERAEVALLRREGLERLTPEGAASMGATLEGVGRASRVRRAVLEAVDAGRRYTAADLTEMGVDGFGVMRVFDALDAAEVRGVEVEALRRDVALVLRAGPQDFEPLLVALHDPAPDALAGLAEALDARTGALAAAAPVEPPRLLMLAPHERTVGGVCFALVELVADGMLRREAGVPVWIGECVRRGGGPALRLRRLNTEGRVDVEHLEPLPVPERDAPWAELEAAARARAAALIPTLGAGSHGAARLEDEDAGGGAAEVAGEVARPEPMAAVWEAATRALLRANAGALGIEAPPEEAGDLAVLEALVGLKPRTWRIGGGWTRLSGVWTGEWLLLGDVAFVEPGLETWAVSPWEPRRAVGATSVLLGLLGGGEVVRLYAWLKEAAARFVESGEAERLGTGQAGDGRPTPWVRGAYVFTSPTREAAAYHAGQNPVAVVFEVPWGVLEEAVGQGLWACNVFVADAGQVLDPRLRLGVADAAVEVVALGHEGAQALWAWRVRSA